MTNHEPKLLTATRIDDDTWIIKKCRLKEQFPDLNDFDLDVEDGKLEELIDKLHAKIGATIGKTKDELHKLVEAL
jgi:hypothetical protein